MHDGIDSLEAFVETFLYFFSQGSNAELSALDKDLFFMFVDRLKEKKISTRFEIGCHSSFFALRAQVEGCRAFITPTPSEFLLRELVYKDGRDLVMPLELIQQVLGDFDTSTEVDTHLVFEFRQGDRILGHEAPRSNRFYFVNDPNGASIK